MREIRTCVKLHCAGGSDVEIRALLDPTRCADLLVPVDIAHRLNLGPVEKDVFIVDGRREEHDPPVGPPGTHYYGKVSGTNTGDWGMGNVLNVFVDDTLAEPVLGRKGIERALGVRVGLGLGYFWPVLLQLLGLILFVQSFQILGDNAGNASWMDHYRGYGQRAVAWYRSVPALLSVLFMIGGPVLFIWATFALVKSLGVWRRLGRCWRDFLQECAHSK